MTRTNTLKGIGPRSLVAPNTTAEIANAKRRIKQLHTQLADANATIACLRGEIKALRKQLTQGGDHGEG